jgi:hypothetical protein
LLPNLFSEETVLVSLSDDGGSVVARKTVMFNRNDSMHEASSEEIELSLEEAGKIQDENIAIAEAKGWQKMAFLERDNDFRHYSHDRRYRTYSFADVEPGVEYYCEISSLSYQLGRDLLLVEPKFQVLYLPKAKVASSHAEPVAEDSGVRTLTLGGSSLKVRV